MLFTTLSQTPRCEADGGHTSTSGTTALACPGGPEDESSPAASSLGHGLEKTQSPYGILISVLPQLSHQRPGPRQSAFPPEKNWGLPVQGSEEEPATSVLLAPLGLFLLGKEASTAASPHPCSGGAGRNQAQARRLSEGRQGKGTDSIYPHLDAV